jgi:capsular exopolysaccharide synthesis family protein
MNLVTLTHPQSAAAEAYRTLRTNLYFATLDKPVQTIVITSPAQDEGKTAALANLAVVMAQVGQRVIAVDADLRKPALHEAFGLSNGDGLTNLLLDDPPGQKPNLRETTVAGLLVLTSGKPVPNPLDLLNSRRMGDTLAALKGMADVVLLDAPPVTAVSDTAVLASQTDGVLLVIHTGKTRREHADHAKDLLKRARANLIGAVMINAPNTRGL